MFKKHYIIFFVIFFISPIFSFSLADKDGKLPFFEVIFMGVQRRRAALKKDTKMNKLDRIGRIHIKKKVRFGTLSK